MPSTIKTPGVYIVEKDAFPNSAVPVATSIPAFIGYTKNTCYQGKSLHNKAIKIHSFPEFLEYFGHEPPSIKFDIEKGPADAPDFTYGDDNAAYTLKPTGPIYRMYSALRFFYQNGGGTCYIISVGDYSGPLKLSALKAGIAILEKEIEPSLLVIPEAIELIAPTHTELNDKYAAAYEIQSDMINHCGTRGNRMAILDIPRGYWEPLANPSESIDAFRKNVNPSQAAYNSYAAAYYPWLHTSLYQETDLSSDNLSSNAKKEIETLLKMEATKFPEDSKGAVLLLISELTGQPAGEGANKPPEENPKLSEGVLIWGARTLDGNSLDWRYINVRRTAIFLEQSIKLAIEAYVFEANVASTWLSIERMIENFLTGVWKQGGLAGAVPDDAFSVAVGLGSTMTAEDILEGILRISVKVALSHPAEFIEINFEQGMQKS